VDPLFFFCPSGGLAFFFNTYSPNDVEPLPFLLFLWFCFIMPTILHLQYNFARSSRFFQPRFFGLVGFARDLHWTLLFLLIDCVAAYSRSLSLGEEEYLGDLGKPYWPVYISGPLCAFPFSPSIPFNLGAGLSWPMWPSPPFIMIANFSSRGLFYSLYVLLLISGHLLPFSGLGSVLMKLSFFFGFQLTSFFQTSPVHRCIFFLCQFELNFFDPAAFFSSDEFFPTLRESNRLFVLLSFFFFFSFLFFD